MEKEIVVWDLHYIRSGYHRAALQCLMREWQVSGKPFSAGELN